MVMSKNRKAARKIFRQDKSYCCVYYGLRILPQNRVNKKAPELTIFYLLNIAYVMNLQKKSAAIFNGE